MATLGLTEEEIRAFADPHHWLYYFPQHCQSDLRKMGLKVDWRRSFCSTDVNPYHDSFIQWQFWNLKAKQLIKFGKRYTMFSPKDKQPCMDHDRSSGEGVVPQEYTLIKFKALKPYPPKLQSINKQNICIVAATLKPESMHGKINCCIHPYMVYVACEQANGDVFISTRRSALNMSYQGFSKTMGKVDVLVELVGQDIIGMTLESPFSVYERIYTLPMWTIKEGQGTGVEISVQSDNTADYTAVVDFKKNKNAAVQYMEPATRVVSRSGSECIVALCDQWYLHYGDEEWKGNCKKAISNLKTFCDKVKESFEATQDVLQEHACSRSNGLGTKIPWDEKYLVDSMSDSTIYQAYYAVAHLLHEGHIHGRKMGPSYIQPKQMTNEVWDYIFFKDATYPSTDIPINILNKMKLEFEYWYPLDLTVSGKELVPNHLTYIMNGHAAMWPDQPQKWPKAMRANGHLLLNSEKMSKSTGNFLSLYEAIDKFSADGMRLALADAGDDTEDANFVEIIAEEAVLRLYTYLEWVRETLDIRNTLRTGEFNRNDTVFQSDINMSIEVTKSAFDEMKYKEALRTGFLEFQAMRDKYCSLQSNDMHRDLVLRYIEVQTLMLSPICPHMCEYVWSLLGKSTSIMNSSWPEQSKTEPFTLQEQTDATC